MDIKVAKKNERRKEGENRLNAVKRSGGDENKILCKRRIMTDKRKKKLREREKLSNTHNYTYTNVTPV